MSLKKYQQKRHFDQTSEPQDNITDLKHPIYVIQKHAASRLHYDLRLEAHGALMSWAVPKGPSLDPAVKRLAVAVEDHPLSYATFEGIIPKGQYGAGTVIVWDIGTWEVEGDLEKSLKKGHLSFYLHGQKLHGKWSLIRMKDDEKNWLLMKDKDEYANSHIDIVETQPQSVLHDQSRTIDPSQLHNARKAPFPENILPQMATLVSAVPEGDDWLHEIKFDGYRLLSTLNHNDVRLWTRRQNDWTHKFPGIVEVLKTLPVKTAILDGEVVAFDENGRSDFQALQNMLERKKTQPLRYYIFDLLYLQGYDLWASPLIERKELLKQLFVQWQPQGDKILFSDHILGHGETLFTQVCDLGLEGIISKNIHSPYRQKRTEDWQKIKCTKAQEFVIGGYSDPKGHRPYFGALLLGYYDKKKFHYCGRVGTGFSDQSLQDIYAELKELEQDRMPFHAFPTDETRRDVHWVKPKLVAEVKYEEWTDDGRLRQAAFLGLRSDKNPKDVTREQPKLVAEVANVQEKIAVLDKIKLTNPDRIFFPEDHVTKQDLAEFYAKIAEWILPHVAHRPLMILRCPEGYKKECFYQKHMMGKNQAFLYPLKVIKEDGEEQYITIRDIEGLISLIQMGTLEIHPWGSRDDEVGKPDRMIFDLDPDPEVIWSEVIECAQIIRQILDEMGLKSFVKTSGGKGLHVVVPLVRRLFWPDIKTFSQNIAKFAVKMKPDLYTTDISKAKRKKKIFIDYLRNNQGSTCVAAYSTRAKIHVPISTPLTWEELPTLGSAQTYTIKNILGRLQTIRNDPWEGFFDIKQSITKNMQTLLESMPN